MKVLQKVSDPHDFTVQGGVSTGSRKMQNGPCHPSIFLFQAYRLVCFMVPIQENKKII
jgi:hypothetical protein